MLDYTGKFVNENQLRDVQVYVDKVYAPLNRWRIVYTDGDGIEREQPADALKWTEDDNGWYAEIPGVIENETVYMRKIKKEKNR